MFIFILFNWFTVYTFFIDYPILFLFSYSCLFFCLHAAYLFLFFFFSSRRRYTSWPCDWGSDVCSSVFFFFLFYFLFFLSVYLISHRDFSHLPSQVPPAAMMFRSGRPRLGEGGKFPWSPDSLKKKKQHKQNHTNHTQTKNRYSHQHTTSHPTQPPINI